MDKICGVVDFQGFKINRDYFIPKEMALASDYISLCSEINPEKEIHEFDPSVQKIIKFITHNKTGLHLKPFNDVSYCFVPKISEIQLVLKNWYQLVWSQDKPLIAYINNETGKILKDCGIPCINLNETILNFPSYKEIQLKNSSNYLCGFHKSFAYKYPKRYKCSYRKVGQVYKELKDRLNINEKDWFEQEKL